MNRYAIENLFGIEGLNIAWYGLIIACGMVLGFALGSIKHSLCQFAVRNLNQRSKFFLIIFLLAIKKHNATEF